jgi:diamine N-acetyltransferase
MTGLLENKHVRLRSLEPEDLEILYKWENNTEIWCVSNTLVPFSKHVLKQYLENAHLDIFQTKQFRFIIETIEGEPIGAIDLFDFDPYHNRAGIGILIAEKSKRNYGFGTEALKVLINYTKKVLQLNQLFCNITADNFNSIRLFENAGFERTGIKKHWIKTFDGFLDEYFYQLEL